jgi:hypothetical protein
MYVLRHIDIEKSQPSLAVRTEATTSIDHMFHVASRYQRLMLNIRCAMYDAVAERMNANMLSKDVRAGNANSREAIVHQMDDYSASCDTIY